MKTIDLLRLKFPRLKYRYAVLLGVLVLGGIWTYTQVGQSGTSRGRNRPMISVQTTPVGKETVRDMRILTGTLFAKTEFAVSTKIAGTLKELKVDVGDFITSGQVVARLDDAELVQQRNQARAELGVARAAVVEAYSLLTIKKYDFERIRQLFAKRIGSENNLESARAQSDAQEARVEFFKAQVVQREAALRAAEVRLSYSVVRIHWNGAGKVRVVGERFASEGEMLPANKPIISVLDLGALIAVVNASEQDYPLLHVDQPVAVLVDSFPDRRFEGKIARVAPRFQQSSRQARIEVDVPNLSGLLKPGMFVRSEVEVGRVENGVMVPAESVVIREGRKGVFVVNPEDGSAKFVPVLTGLSRGDRIQIVEPALTGRVINLGQHLLRDGLPVRLPDENAPKGGAGKRTGGKRGKREKKP